MELEADEIMSLDPKDDPVADQTLNSLLSRQKIIERTRPDNQLHLGWLAHMNHVLNAKIREYEAALSGRAEHRSRCYSLWRLRRKD